MNRFSATAIVVCGALVLIAAGCGKKEAAGEKAVGEADASRGSGKPGSPQSDIQDYSIGFRVQPSILGGSGRYNFGDMYKDAVKFGNGVTLDIAYQSTFMQVNGKDGVFHYGLRAKPSEISLAKEFAAAYEKHKPSLKKDRITLRDEPDPDIILLCETPDGFVPVAHYEVKKE